MLKILDLDQVLSTQTCIFSLCKCTKIDRSGPKQTESDLNRPNWTKWIEHDKMDKIRMNGLNMIRVDRMDRMRLNWTEWDQIGPNSSIMD